jgi:signal transduction histidine kinase
VGKTRGIRHRLLTILLLGAIVSALSLSALVHLLSTTTHQRVERARDTAAEQALRLARDPRVIVQPAANAVVGMRGGIWQGSSLSYQGLPTRWAVTVERAVRASEREHGPTTLDAPLDDSTLVVAAHPMAGSACAWAAFLVRPLPSLRTWQWIVSLLALATVGLVATTLYSIVTVQRGASELRKALQALATDLTVPIPRLTVRELSSVAEGVERLAEDLGRARREEARLQGELAKRERLAALGRVVAGVAHEVRNPLASIKLRLDLAAAGTALPPEVDTAIAHAATEIARLDRLVADLLIVSGRASGERRVLSLGALVRARGEALSPWARERGVRIACMGDANAEVDADSVARSIDNLLRNAIEASRDGEQVEASVGARSGLVTVSISDAGSGVAAEHARELFEPFFTTKPDGTGLGLALCRAIARAHGGDVQYTRAGGKTRFDLSLPAIPASSTLDSRTRNGAPEPASHRPWT